MAFRKNLRGAMTYATPSTKTYRDNYDAIFGPKKVPEADEEPPCHHALLYRTEDGWKCRDCGETVKDEAE